MNALDRVLDALNAAGLKPEKNGNGYKAFCAVHEAAGGHKTKSLNVSQGRTGALVTCWSAGCRFEDIASALGLEKAQMFDDWKSGTTRKREEVARYTYHNEDGTPRFDKIRMSNYVDKDTFYQSLPGRSSGSLDGVGNVLFGLPDIKAAIEAGETVLVVEGEKDVLNCRKQGFVATCNPEGAAQPHQKPKWRPEYSETLRGATVAVLADNDAPGEAHATAVSNTTNGIAASVKRIHLDGLPNKGDISDWFNNGGTAKQLRGLIAAAPEWEPSQNNDTTSRSSWSEVDMSLIDPDKIPEPTILFRDDMQPILYPGVRNVLFGPSESAKSWFAAHAIRQEAEHLEQIDPGGTRKAAVVIDFEDIPEVWKYRLRMLGLPDDVINRRVAYHRPMDPPLDNEIADQLGDNLRQAKIVVIDSMNESTYVLGLSPSGGEDIGEWRNKFLRPIEANLNSDDPAAILVIDHTGHDQNLARVAAIGSYTKLTGVRGVQIRAHVIEKPAPGRHGAIALYVAKDTNGKVREISTPDDKGRDYLGTFILDSAGLYDRVEARIVNPGLEVDNSAENLAAVIDMFIEHDSEKGLSMNQAEQLTIGKITVAATKKRLIVKQATEMGHLETFPSGSGVRYRLAKHHRKAGAKSSSDVLTSSDEPSSSQTPTNSNSETQETLTPVDLKLVGRTPDEPGRGARPDSSSESTPLGGRADELPDDLPDPY